MTRLIRRLWAGIVLVGLFAYELVLSSFRVAWDVLTPSHRSRPGILAIPLRASSDGEITALTNLVSLTPGSLSLDVAPDRRTLYVHVMFVDDPQAERDAIKALEAKVSRVWR